MTIHEPPMDLSGDCVATAYHDRCPACGDLGDFCQGHGEIGDPAGYAILIAHEDERHEDCLKVSDVFGTDGDGWTYPEPR